jgi:hypothetical protein
MMMINRLICYLSLQTRFAHVGDSSVFLIVGKLFSRLQDIVTTLRRKIQTMEQSTQVEVKRLTSEVIKLHRNIKDILLKAEHFCAVNEAKYFQLWKFNHDSAQKLLDKVCVCMWELGRLTFSHKIRKTPPKQIYGQSNPSQI